MHAQPPLSIYIRLVSDVVKYANVHVIRHTYTVRERKLATPFFITVLIIVTILFASFSVSVGQRT
jgi:hypothetical protein